MLLFIQNLYHLIFASPLALVAATVFGLLGLWMGYLIWHVSARRMEALADEQRRLRDGIEDLKQRLEKEGGPGALKPISKVPVRGGEEGVVPIWEEVLVKEDDFTQLEGVTPEIETRLKDSGFKRFRDLAELDGMGPEESDRFARTYGLDQVPVERWRWAWTGGSPPEPPGHEPERFLAPVAGGDDLTRIQSIDGALQERLRALGVTRYGEIASWGDIDVVRYSDQLGLRDRIARERWVEQAAELSLWSAAEEGERFVAPESVDQAAEMQHFEDGSNQLTLDPYYGILYRSRPQVTDDLQRIDGVGAAEENVLNSLGIYRYWQISHWSRANVEALARQLDLTVDRIEREKWIPQAWRLHREIYAASPYWGWRRPTAEDYERLIDQKFAGEAVRAHDSLGVVYSVRPEEIDELSLIRGVGPAMEQELHNAGVYRFRQIGHWSAENVDAFAARAGCLPDRVYREGWIPQAAELDRSETGAAQPLAAGSVDQALQQYGDAGIYQPGEPDLLDFSPAQPEPVAGGTPAAEEAVAIDDDPHRLAAMIPESGVHYDSVLGYLYSELPADRDSLTEIRGVSPGVEGLLQGLGIFRFWQIAHWTPEVASGVSQRIGLPVRRLERERWVAQAAELALLAEAWRQDSYRAPERVDLETLRERDFAGDDAVRIDLQLGFVFDAEPSVVDDLREIEAITPHDADALQRIGVFRFKQVGAWSDANVAAVSRLTGVEKDRIDREKWVAQARDLQRSRYRMVDGWNEEAPDLESFRERAAQQFAGEDVQVDQDFGITLRTQPLEGDELFEIDGIEPGMAERLNEAGVYRFKQMANWSLRNVSTYAVLLGIPSDRILRERWISQAGALQERPPKPLPQAEKTGDMDEQLRRMHQDFPGEAVRVDRRFGIVYGEMPPVIDDLTQMQGVDSEMEQALRQRGIFRFKQVAAWNEVNLGEAAVLARRPVEEIVAEDWIGQAQRLHQEIYGTTGVWLTDRPAEAEYRERLERIFPGETLVADEEMGMVFAAPPAHRDRLSAIQGIDDDSEERLNAAGVYRYRQIANWSRANVAAFAGLLKKPADLILKARWMEQAARLDQETGEVVDAGEGPQASTTDYFAILREFFADEPVRVDRKLGIVYGTGPVIADPLDQIDGISAEQASMLNELGVHRFRQIAHWDEAVGSAFAHRLNLSPEDVRGARWVEQAQRLDAELYSASPAWAVDRPSESDYERKLAELFAGEDAGYDPELGILYAGPPPVKDPLQRIEGIEAGIEQRLNASGVYRFKQIGHWAHANVRAFADWLGLEPARIYHQRWIRQAMALAAKTPAAVPSPAVTATRDESAKQFEVMLNELEGVAGVRVDRMLGIVFDVAPSAGDDLTRIEGVNDEAESTLRRLGVHRFVQVAHWSEPNVNEFARALGLSAQTIRDQRWREQALDLHRRIYRASPVWPMVRPSLEDYRRQIEERFAGEAVRADDHLGIIYRGRPAKVDRLTRIEGLDDELERRLNASGVYRFKQIALWSDANVTGFASWIGCPRERVYQQEWIPQALRLQEETEGAASEPAMAPVREDWTRFASAEGATTHPEWGYVFAEQPSKTDELTLIRGVDEGISARLNELGIFRFWQMVLWDERRIHALEDRLGIEGRIERERWVPQATEMALIDEALESESYEAPKAVDLFAAIELDFEDDDHLRADPDLGLVYDAEPPVTDDLTRIEGVTGTMAQELNRVGVYRFKQIAHWSNQTVRSISRRTGGSADLVAREKWIPQACLLHRRIYDCATRWAVDAPSLEEYEALARREFEGEPVRVDRELGILFQGRAQQRDDLCRIEGIDLPLRRRLNASGVYGFNQIANWSDANVRAFGERLGFPRDRVYREAWIAQAALLAESEPEERLADELPMPSLTRGEDEAAVPEVPAVFDEILGRIYRQRPHRVDDLQQIHGVSAKLQRKLHELGVYRFRQIAGWTDRNVAEFSGRLHVGDAIRRENWIRQAAELSELHDAEALEAYAAPPHLDQVAALDAVFAGEKAVRVDPDYGIVFDGRPEITDDLRAIDGIGGRVETELHRLGVYRYHQIAHWTDRNVEVFAEALAFRKDRIERDKWVLQAKRLHRETYAASRAWGVERPTVAEYQRRIEEVFMDEAVRADADLGVVYTGWPSHVDDLQAIGGIDEKMEQGLNWLGVYCVKQIANWSVANVEAFARRLAIAEQRIYRDRWIAQAAELPCVEPVRAEPAPPPLDEGLRRVLSEQTGVSMDGELGFVYDERPVDVDDLTRIKGIGEKLSEALNELGVYRYRQIACWSERHVGAFDRRLRLRQRIQRENWAGQARELSALMEELDSTTFVAPSASDQEAALELDFSEDEGARVDARLGIVLDRTPHVMDDLTLINGVGAQLERELNDMGVYRFKQIAKWTDSNVGHFAERLFIHKERIERDKWVPQAKLLHREIYAASSEWGVRTPSVEDYQAVIRAEFAGEPLRADADYGIVFTSAPKLSDDLKLIGGIGSKIEQQLNEAGVHRYRQIALWSERNVESFAERLKLQPERIYRDRWIAQAARLKSAPVPVAASTVSRVGTAASTRPAPEPEPAAKPAARPAKRVLEGPPAEPVRSEEVRARSNDAVSPWRDRLKGESGLEDRGELGLVFRKRPARVSELQLIRGVGPLLEEKLHDFGIFRFEQIAAWTPVQIREFSKRLDFKGRIEREQWVAQAADLADLADAEERDSYRAPEQINHEEVLSSQFGRERHVRLDEELGIVYDHPPEVVDDLQKINGIGPKLAAELNTFGVYRFKQLVSWTDANVEAFAERLDCFKDRIERDKWIPQAKRLHLQTYTASTIWGMARPAVADYQARIRTEFNGENVEADADFGIVFRGEPDHRDSLRRVKGIGKRYEEVLNDLGVYQFRQIALWSDANVERFAEELGCVRDRIYQDGWMTQARQLAASVEPPGAGRESAAANRTRSNLAATFAGESVVLDDQLGAVFESAPEQIDDLKKIYGIGAKLEGNLNDFGVYQYRQIALWTESNAKEFAKRLDAFQDRMFRDNWIQQARELHEAKYGEKL